MPSGARKAYAAAAAISAEAYADANAHPSGNDYVGADDDVELARWFMRHRPQVHTHMLDSERRVH